MENMLTIIFMYAVLAAGFTISKQALNYVNPFFFVACRISTAALLLLLFQYLFDRKNFFIRKRDIPLFIKTSLFYVYLVFGPEIWALNRLTSTKVVIIYSTVPFITVIFAYFLLAKRITIQKIFGMITGLAGIVLLVMTPNNGSEIYKFMNISAGELILLIAAVSVSYGWFLVKQLLDRGYTVSMINGTTMLSGGLAILLTSLIFEGHPAKQIFSVAPFLFWTSILIVLSSLTYYNLYVWNLRRYSLTLISFAGFLSPVFGTFYGWYFLSETIRWNHFASLALIGTGLCIFFRGELKR